MIVRIFSITISFCFVLFLHAQNKPTIEWIDVPGGTFTMRIPEHNQLVGRDAESKKHNVTISGFKTSKFEITVKQFKAFVDETGYITSAEKESMYCNWVNSGTVYQGPGSIK